MAVASMTGPAMAPARFRRLAVETSLPLVLRGQHVPTRHRTLFYRSDMAALLRSERFDLVHIHNPMPALEMRRIARACRKLGLPYVVSTHGFNEVVNGLKVYAFNAVQRAVWRNAVVEPVRQVVAHAARVFALSPHDVDLLRLLGQRTDNVTIVGNGVSNPEPANERRDGDLLATLGVTPRSEGGAPTFLFLANHTPNKGLPVLLEAFARLTEPYQLILGGERREAVAYAKALSACRPGQRILVTGRLSDAETQACFRRADVFVFPTLADTFPLVVLEAMSHGLAVVASRVGGIPHQIDADSGVLVEPGDPDALVQALLSLVHDRRRIERLGSAARARARSQFNWPNAALAAFEGYERALTEAGSARPASVASRRLVEDAGANVIRLR
ncbi:hypothetical protein ASG48_02810 [Aurantimonas sp. Leaf443]|nr:hypothetical protein ASG48_02810 [Aurantimonas sp. Leaf443]